MGKLVAIVFGFTFLMVLMMPSGPGGTFSSTSNASSSDRIEVRADPERASSSDSGQASYGEVRLNRGDGGQFHVDARINGTSLPFLVDTGADMVALTIDDARRLGIYINPYEFEPVGTGAGGALRGKPVMLNQVEIGGRTLTNVQAVVIEGLETNLLGQSVLREFGKVELSGDTMVIRT